MPTVYSMREMPITQGPWMAGWMKSSESNTAVALGQPSSKRPRRSAVSIALRLPGVEHLLRRLTARAEREHDRRE